VVLLSFWGEPVGFFFVEHLGVSSIFLWDLFGSGDGGVPPFCPCLWPGHCDLSLFPVDLGIKGSQPWVAKYYPIFSQTRLVEVCGVPLVSTLDSHFAVSFDPSCFIGGSVNIGELDWLF